jgi:hypothetical protein
MEERHADLEFEQSAIRIENILAGKDIQEEVISPLYLAPPFSADLPVPPVPPPSCVQLAIEHSAKPNLYQRLCRNRIGRVLKVLWRGYY